MKTYLENTTLVQTSELRTKLDEVLKLLPKQHVILEKHHKPVAVLVDPAEFTEIEEIREAYSDIMLALEARRRETRKNPKYITLEELMKRVGL